MQAHLVKKEYSEILSTLRTFNPGETLLIKKEDSNVSKAVWSSTYHNNKHLLTGVFSFTKVRGTEDTVITRIR